MKGLRLSLRHKLVLLMTVVIAALTLIVFTYLDVRLQRETLRSSRDEARRLAELTSFAVSPALLFDDVESAREALVPSCRSSIVARVDVLNATGAPFADCTGAGTSGKGLLVATVPITSGNQKIGVLRLSLSLGPISEQIATTRRWLAVISVVIFGVGMAMTVAISLFVTRPLQQITATAEAIRAGDSTRRAQATSNDEVGALARTFNSMLDELELNRHHMEQLNHSLEQTVDRRTREVTMLLQSTYDGIVAVDERGRCVMLNRAAGVTLGIKGIDAIGRDVHELLHAHCTQRDCTLVALLRANSAHQSKEALTRADGSSISVDVTVAPMRDGEQTTGTVMTFRDVTERDELQQQLELATRLNSLGTLAAKVAHEFNNVLMGILPFVEMIRRATTNDSKMATWTDTIAQSVNRGKRITQEVLRFTRPQAPNRRILSIENWLDEFGQTLRVTAGKGVRLNIDVREDELVIAGDREQLEQLLINLVSNARDAMQSKGMIDVIARLDGDFVRISIVDNGPGMPAETARRVFEPFFTTKKLGGTGLGLSIAEQIVKAHCGTIEVSTTPGQGTCFDVRIPLSNGAGAKASVTLPRRESFRGRVLIIEDDAAVASGIKALLEERGATCDVALTGQAALVGIHIKTPDAIVLDVGLPDIDGITLYGMIAEMRPDLPVIFSTGHADEGDVRGLLSRQNVRFLMKPYPAEALVDALAEATSRPVFAELAS